MGIVHMQGFQYLCAVGNDQKGSVLLMLIGFYPGGYGTHRIHVKTGISLIKDGEFRLEHEKLQDFRLLLFSSGKACVQIPVLIGAVKIQYLHIRCKILAVLRKLNLLTGFLHYRVPYKGRYRNPGDLKRILERHEHPGLCPFIRAFVLYIEAVEIYASGGDLISRISHQCISECRFARAIGAHQHMGLSLPYTEVYALKYFISLYGYA